MYINWKGIVKFKEKSIKNNFLDFEIRSSFILIDDWI